MYYVYVLQSVNEERIYIGATNDLRKRYMMHNKGKTRSTKNHLPIILIYYEAFLHKEDAFERERYLKTGWGRNYLKKSLKNILKSKSFGR